MVEPKLTMVEALQELRDVLFAVVTTGSTHRDLAVRYMRSRAALMEGELRPLVPGFLVQCSSIGKFHDFITLYHPHKEARIAFFDESLDACWARLNISRVSDVFGESGF